MRAIVLDAPGPPDALTIRELPVPTPVVGWVLIEVKAFGLNRSELHTRQGLASGVTFPRVLGIEAGRAVNKGARPCRRRRQVEVPTHHADRRAHTHPAAAHDGSKSFAPRMSRGRRHTP